MATLHWKQGELWDQTTQYDWKGNYSHI